MQDLPEIVGHPLHIFLLTQDEEFVAFMQSLWSADQVCWSVFPDGQSALEQVLTEPPDMIVAEQSLPGLSGMDVLRILKGENVYRRICVILAAKSEFLPDLTGDVNLYADELVVLPTTANELRLRMKLALCRIIKTMDTNPLTRLPGNICIINTIQCLLTENVNFAMAYVDMDNFKPYNDKYGFSRGDEILLMAARLIVNVVNEQQCEPSFVGHIGGDDFVFILPHDVMEKACKRLIENFDAIVPSFYDLEDRERGFIISHDRLGHEQTFPVVGISIAVVICNNSRYTHYAQLSHVAMQLKGIAKKVQGSTYVLDRRGNPPPIV